MRTTFGFLATGGFLAVTSLLVAPGCGDDGDGGSGGTGGGTTTATTTGTTTTGTSTTTTTTGTSGGGGSSAELSCEAYCTAIMANCADANQQYTDETACLTTCVFEEGTAADTSGNTLGCRTYHADAAKDDPATHCAHAGPLGGGACGDAVDAFCQIAVSVCTGGNEVWADEATCVTDVGAVNNTVAYNTTVMAGDSLACRMYHLQFGATSPDQATLHCQHVAVDSQTCTD